MSGETDPPEAPTRSAEVVAAACLATDLGMGFPFEHGFHATLITMRLVELCGADRIVASQAYHASLLMYAGCMVEAHISSRIFGSGMTHLTPVQFGSPVESTVGVIRALPDPGDPPHVRALSVAQRLPRAFRHRTPHFAGMCEVAAMLADRLGVPVEVPAMFAFLTERWDGKGALGRARGEEIPLALRIVHVARDAAFQRLVGGDAHAGETIRRRGGGAFDPAIAELFVDHQADIFAAADVAGSAWDATLDVEPRPWLMLDGAATDRALAALGDFADLVSPSLAGHSGGVADLCRAAAKVAGLGHADALVARRAGWLHDIGRVAVDPGVWQTPGPLTADAWEQVRLHPYHVERVSARSPSLATIAAVASAHHERLDASGYHRGVAAASLPLTARLVAAADVYRAVSEPRPYRPARSSDQAAAVLIEEGRLGRLDPACVSAVLEAAGHGPAQIERPAGLTEREVEVLGLLARGYQTKQVARALGISAKTADRHVQNAYRKAGISTRAGATMFAMEHGLVPWGGSPIASHAATS